MKNIKEAIVLSLSLSLILPVSVTLAAPQGAQVVSGGADIRQNGAATVIDQKSDRAVINWHSFDIGRHEAVRHNMPSASSAGLHRVVGGGGASQIQGLLQSNGNIYLVNPAGVVIHKGAKVDTNGFIATTRDIADSNFMKGKMVFDKPGLAGAQIINKGEITVKDSGLAALVAPSVRNEGLIAAKLGKVALASGEGSWSLDMHGDDLITFTVDEHAVNNLHGADGKPLASVENSGSIKAEGGVVVLTAAQLDGIVGSVVNSGEISAASAEISGGMITFKGQGSGVDISNTGTLDVSSAVADAGSVRMDTDGKLSSSGSIAATGGKKGGKVTLTGQDVALKGSAKIDASGNTGGGTVLVGGNALGKGPERNAKTTKVEQGVAIHADARVKGDGGQVVVWSDETTNFDGTVTAQGGSEGGNGGQVETSGKDLNIGDAARVSTLAPKGLFGEWLLDPVDFVIAESGGNVSGDDISTMLAENNITFASNGGSVYVNDDIIWTSAAALTLNAYKNIDINKTITATHDNAGLYLYTDTGDINLRAKITLSGENPILVMDGNRYTVINTIEDLQNINHNTSGYFALGTDIDASDTKNWNEGSGFIPIGYDTPENAKFSGVFNGLGHVISGLTVNRPYKKYVGLFGYASFAKICNVGLENVYIIGEQQVGGMIGCADNTEIYNCYTTGSVAGHWYVGGFVARLYGGLLFEKTDTTEIYNCYSYCNLSKLYESSDYFGGFIALADGWNSRVYNSYCTGYVPATTNSGGFYADLGYTGFIEKSFYDKEVQGKNNYAIKEWDFTNIWTSKEGEDYPELKLFASVVPAIPTPPVTEPDPGTGGGSTELDPGTGETIQSTPLISSTVYANNNDLIYIDKNRVVIEEFEKIPNGRRILMNSASNLSNYIYDMRKLIYDSNIEILKIYKIKSAVSALTTSALTTIISKNFGNIINATKEFASAFSNYITDSDVAKSACRLFLSDYFFELSEKSVHLSMSILNSEKN